MFFSLKWVISGFYRKRRGLISQSYKEVAENFGAEVPFIRPSEISQDDALADTHWLGKITLLLLFISSCITTIAAIIVVIMLRRDCRRLVYTYPGIVNVSLNFQFGIS